MSQTPQPAAQNPPVQYPAVFNGQTLKELTEAALTWLRTNQQTVNALNVFPVPDGDTGTNMLLTMQSAYDEIRLTSEKHAGKVVQSIAHGALMGARGNSGVILSQLWRGFARALDGCAVIDGAALVRAFATARDTAYKGVVRPVEGTILTVAKDIAADTAAALENNPDLFHILQCAVQAADASVMRTPEYLPVLREAGVVDSGGKGLFFILEGMLRHLQGLPLDTPLTSVQPLSALNLENSLEEIEPGQDYEVVLDFRPFKPLDLQSFYADLERMGTSIQIGEGDGMYRVHIHVPTEKRYEPIDYAIGLGTVTKVAIENLMAQMDEIELRAAQPAHKLSLAAVNPGEIAVVTVVPGAGIARVFASFGVAAIVEGGQTMNPSTQEILKAFENLPTDKIIILPNNKNIILAAQASRELTVKQVAIVPSLTVPQGLAALLRLNPNGNFDDVVAEMTAALEDVQTGEITTAIRSVDIDDVQVSEGQTIALLNGKLIAAVDDVESACLTLLDEANAADYELITLFYGQNISRTQVNKIADAIRSAYPDQTVEVQEGGQPHYQFIISIE